MGDLKSQTKEGREYEVRLEFLKGKKEKTFQGEYTRLNVELIIDIHIMFPGKREYSSNMFLPSSSLLMVECH